MKTMTSAMLFAFALVIMIPRQVSADVCYVSPSEMVVLPDDGSGVVKVAFKFELSQLRAGANRRIEEALLVWPLTQVSTTDAPELSVYSATKSWTKSAVEKGAALETNTTKISDWQMNLMAPETNEGRLMRLDLTNLVEGWTKGETANYGVVVTTSDVPVKTLTSQTNKVQLIIRYGFRD